MTLIIFIVGLIVTTAVCFALFGYTIHEMKPGEQTDDTSPELIK